MEHVVIETPEHIEFTYELAGLGSRFLAQLYDLIIQSLALAATWTAIGFVISQLALWESPLGVMGQVVVVAFLFLMGFLILWGYFVFFEIAWNGQTPGKRLVRIRVIKAGGYPIRFTDVLLRNLFRIIDFLPAFYLVGAGLIFFDRWHRRLGDMIAQTLIVKERQEALPQTLGPLGREAPAAEPPMRIQAVTEQMYALIREFLLRREELAHGSRVALARRLAAPVLAAMEEREGAGMDYEEFLEEVARQYREWRRL